MKKSIIIYLSISAFILLSSFCVGYIYQFYFVELKYDMQNKEQREKEDAEQQKLKEKFIAHPNSLNFIDMTQDRHCYKYPAIVHLNEKMEIDSVIDDETYSPYDFNKYLYEEGLIYAMILANKNRIPKVEKLVYHSLADKRSYCQPDTLSGEYLPHANMRKFAKKYYKISK